ncbi:MAG TPA: hypothetical protein VM889_14805 [Candidatus Thermoplasmatota archaeon]|nr:hypothetical protein [Candidatus Thermoplasmatota archaeon]
MSDLAAFTRDWEAREQALALEHYNQYAGFPHSEARMETLAAEVEALCKDGLARFAREDLPPRLFWAMVSNGAAREQNRLQSAIYRMRNDDVVVEGAGEKVNLNNVRRYNFAHARDAAARRDVFDKLMAKADVLTPVLRERFALSRATYAPHGATPLDVYLVDESITLPRLKEVVDRAARAAKPAFARLAGELTPEVLGKPAMEYFDDMYVYRSVVYGPVDRLFANVDYHAKLAETARGLGFPVERVAIDGEPREGKYSSPVCFGIRIPGDVRVLYQRTSPLGDYESFYHEMGHGLHFACVEADRPFEDRVLIPNGVAEIFSTLFEELAFTPDYLIEDVGLDPAAVADLMRRRRFMELYFLTFYGANAMHKIHFWEDDLVDDLDAADRLYADLTELYMGVRVPGKYWQTHHILSMNDMYAPSYLLANIRKSELRAVLERQYGRRWWREPEAGDFLRDRAMGPGGAIDLAGFSSLDPEAYLKHVVAA